MDYMQIKEYKAFLECFKDVMCPEDYEAEMAELEAAQKYLTTCSDQTFLSLIREYHIEKETECNADYVVNPEQMLKYNRLCQYFMRKAAEDGEASVEIHSEPKYEHGNLTANFIVFDSHGNEIQELCRLMSNCSAISIDAGYGNQATISCTVPNIHIRRKESEDNE